MTQYGLEQAIAEIQAGVARTLAMICNQLIDQKILDRDTLVADLESVRLALAKTGVKELGQAVPATLSIALRQKSDVQP